MFKVMKWFYEWTCYVEVDVIICHSCVVLRYFLAISVCHILLIKMLIHDIQVPAQTVVDINSFTFRVNTKEGVKSIKFTLALNSRKAVLVGSV